jgi:hypothetical protein
MCLATNVVGAIGFVVVAARMKAAEARLNALESARKEAEAAKPEQLVLSTLE